MSELQFTIPTLFGLEGVCADEVRRLKLPQVKAENGRVLCTGSERDLPRLNLNLRTGERVLLTLGRFPAKTFDALFGGGPRPALGGVYSPGRPVPGEGAQPQFGAALGPRLPVHPQKGGGCTAGGGVWTDGPG